MQLSSRALALAGLLTLPVVAQRPILVVDEQGGAGSQFTDLPPAIAAAPDGAVLVVRPGQYSPFTLLGKGLSIVGEDADRVVVRDGAITVGSTGPSQHILLKSLKLGTITGSTVTISGAHGAVVLDDLRRTPPLGVDSLELVIDQCPNVQLHRCTFEAGPAQTGTGLARIRATDSTVHLGFCRIEGLPGRPGPLATDGKDGIRLGRSRCVAVASWVRGGNGAPGDCCNVNMRRGGGGPGVWATSASTFISLRTPTIGGDQGPCLRGICGNFGAGDGIIVASSALAYFEGAEPKGGECCPVGLPVRGSGLAFLHPASNPSSADLLGVQEVGQVVRFALDAEPGSLGALLLAVQPELIPLEPPTLGSLLAAPLRLVGPLMVPDTGRIEWPFAIPAWYPLGETVYGQFVTFDPANEALWTTNSVALHVNR